MKLATFVRRAGVWDGPLDPTLDDPATLLLVFADSGLLDEHDPLADLAETFPRSVMLGCSTAGEVLDSTIDDGTVTVAVAQFEHTRITKAVAHLPEAAGSFMAGESLARQLDAPDLRAVFVLSTGLGVNGSELVRGVNSRLGPDVIVTGGLAGDGSRFARTWVLGWSGPGRELATAVGLYGDRIQVGHGSKGGWDIFGPERKVTRSEGNILYELDGKPALELYKRYLGDLAAGLPATGLRFPLALRETPESDKQLVRTILAVDESDQSMTFAGDIPQGWMAQLMRADFDRLITGAEDAARMAWAVQDGSVGDVLAIAISCVGRRMVLGEAAEEEVEATLEMLPEGTRQVGFYSYGELSPYASGACDLHNQTMTLTTMQET